MSIGVATSNSILLVTFANDQRALGVDARQAAWLAGVTRLRPVLMTALAMILGMLPMALGLGEGGGKMRRSGERSSGVWRSLPSRHSFSFLSSTAFGARRRRVHPSSSRSRSMPTDSGAETANLHEDAVSRRRPIARRGAGSSSAPLEPWSHWASWSWWASSLASLRALRRTGTGGRRLPMSRRSRP